MRSCNTKSSLWAIPEEWYVFWIHFMDNVCYTFLTPIGSLLFNNVLLVGRIGSLCSKTRSYFRDLNYMFLKENLPYSFDLRANNFYSEYICNEIFKDWRHLKLCRNILIWKAIRWFLSWKIVMYSGRDKHNI